MVALDKALRLHYGLGSITALTEYFSTFLLWPATRVGAKHKSICAISRQCRQRPKSYEICCFYRINWKVIILCGGICFVSLWCPVAQTGFKSYVSTVSHLIHLFLMSENVAYLRDIFFGTCQPLFVLIAYRYAALSAQLLSFSFLHDFRS